MDFLHNPMYWIFLVLFFALVVLTFAINTSTFEDILIWIWKNPMEFGKLLSTALIAGSLLIAIILHFLF